MSTRVTSHPEENGIARLPRIYRRYYKEISKYGNMCEWISILVDSLHKVLMGDAAHGYETHVYLLSTMLEDSAIKSHKENGIRRNIDYKLLLLYFLTHFKIGYIHTLRDGQEAISFDARYLPKLLALLHREIEASRRQKKTGKSISYIIKIDTNANVFGDASDNVHLWPGRGYHFDGVHRDGTGATYQEIKHFCLDIIDNFYKTESLLDVPLPINKFVIDGVHVGSIEIILTVVFGAFSILSGIKSLHESIELVRRFINRQLSVGLSHEYGDYLSVDVTIMQPDQNRYTHSHQNSSRPQRDGFFWYLLISNCILLASVGFLVFKAVGQVYGWW